MVDVAAWLRGLNLEQYAGLFDDNAIDGDVLPDLTDQDLQSLGIVLGHRKRLLKAIAALQASIAGAAPAVAPATAAAAGQAVAAQAATDEGAERRQLTVMFCDLVGSTALSNRLDAEDLRDVMREYQQACAEVVAGFDGYVAQYLGDGIMIFFGYPRAHEDNAERAVRAALEMLAAVRGLRQDVRLDIRIGAATGLAVVGDLIGHGTSAEQFAVTGQTPNMAARVQALAEPGTVLVSDSTHRLIGELFDCSCLGRFNLKGIPDPVPIWQVLGLRAVESRFDAVRSTTLSPFVGRDREVQQLVDLWEQAKAGTGQLALLVGEPGIGKSRLTEALRQRLGEEPHALLRYQCSPYHHSSPFYPIISQLERTARLAEEDTPEGKLRNLQAVLRRAGEDTLSDLPLFAALMSVPTEQPLPVSPVRQKELTIEAITRHWGGFAKLQPFVVLFEDAHWADPSTLEALMRSIEALQDWRILVVMTARPEFRPPWPDYAHISTMYLRRLDRQGSAAVVDGIAGGKALPAEVREQIVSKADGVPLFLEELTKTVIESVPRQDEAGHHGLGGGLQPWAVPETLQDSLMARLDRVAVVKEIAQIAAVIGREVPYRLLAAVAEIEAAGIDRALHSLVASELVFCRGAPPDATVVFKHALIRDTAYSSLLRRKRQQIHGRIAKVLQIQFPDLVATHPELLAHHLAQAGQVAEAVEYLDKAGSRAFQRSANAEAITHLEEALALLGTLPPGPARSRRALGLEVLLSRAMVAARGYAAPEVYAALERAKGLLAEVDDPSQNSAVLYGQWACHYVGGQIALQETVGAEFLDFAQHQQNGGLLCLAHRLLGTTAVNKGDFQTARNYLEQALALYDPVAHPPMMYRFGQDFGVTILCYLSLALWCQGLVDQAAAMAEEAIRRARALKHPLTLAYAIGHVRGALDLCRRSAADIRAHVDEGMAVCTEHGIRFWAAGCMIFGGWAMVQEGRGEAGVDQLSAGIDAWSKTGGQVWVPLMLAALAESHIAIGRPQDGLPSIARALAVTAETGECWTLAEVYRVKGLLALAGAGGGVAEAEACFHQSLELARLQQARSWALRTSLDLARLWQDQGKAAEARALLGEALAPFTEGFATPDLVAARAMLDRLEDKAPASPD